MNERVTMYRMRALEAESKALRARADETRRAWEIVARDWNLWLSGKSGAYLIRRSQATRRVE